jgi:hypothetical protein
MDTSDIEDILFSDFDTRAAPEDTLFEDSEDEFLFTASQRESTPWDVWNDTNSTPLANGIVLPSQEPPGQSQVDRTGKLIRDRLFQLSYTAWTMANILQTLGDRSHRGNTREHCGSHIGRARSTHYLAEVSRSSISQTDGYNRRPRTNSRTEGTRNQLSRSKCTRSMEFQYVDSSLHVPTVLMIE